MIRTAPEFKLQDQEKEKPKINNINHEQGHAKLEIANKIRKHII